MGKDEKTGYPSSALVIFGLPLPLEEAANIKLKIGKPNTFKAPKNQ